MGATEFLSRTRPGRLQTLAFGSAPSNGARGTDARPNPGAPRPIPGKCKASRLSALPPDPPPPWSTLNRASPELAPQTSPSPSPRMAITQCVCLGHCSDGKAGNDDGWLVKRGSSRGLVGSGAVLTTPLLTARLTTPSGRHNRNDV